jgi:hypothetical protein
MQIAVKDASKNSRMPPDSARDGRRPMGEGGARSKVVPVADILDT